MATKAATTAPKPEKGTGDTEERSTLEMVVVALGVWCSFLAFGWAAETLTRTEWGEDDAKEKFKFTNFLVLLQSVVNSAVALVFLLLTEGPTKLRLSGGVPVKHWLIVAVSYLGAHEFGMLSLRYIIFPVQVVLKSCKAIPVMLGESLLAGTKHPPSKVLTVVVMCTGVAIFMLGKGAKKGKGKSMDDFDLYSAETTTGLFLVACALVCDGVYGPYQNFITKNVKSWGGAVSPYHLMFNMNAWQGLFALVLCVAHGHNELADVASFCSRHPDIYKHLASFAGTMALGNLFIYRLQRYWGSLTVTITTTMRKLGSVMFSVIWFGHSISAMQWVGVCIVFLSKPVGKVIISSMKAKKVEASKKEK